MVKKICIILLLFVLCCNVTLYSFASSITDLENRQDEIEGNKDALEDRQEEIKVEKTEALSKIEELSIQISESQDELDKLNDEVKKLESEIKQKEEELAEAEKKQKEQEDALEKRVVAQYKNGKMTYWDVLLNPSSPLDFLNKLFCIEKIAKADKQLIDSIEEDKNKIQSTKEQLDLQKSEVKVAKANAEKENVKLKNAKAQKNSQIAKLSDEEKQVQEQIDEYQEEMDKIEAEIRRIAASSKANSTATVFNGEMKWPCPSYIRISSYFGRRSSPNGIGSTNHKGVDLAAPHGSSIIAAESGVVIKVDSKCTHDYGKSRSCGCNGLGKYVMVDHGGGIVSVYGHCSSISVSEGQKVSIGQQIASVGSTGNSTGNHLHFAILLNGTYVNPLPYIT